MDNKALTIGNRPSPWLHAPRAEPCKNRPRWACSRLPTADDGQPCDVVNNVQPALIDYSSCANMRPL